MRSYDEFKFIIMQEFSCYFTSKKPSSSSRADRPGLYVFRVTPHEIAKGALVGNFLIAINRADLIEGPNVRTETTVDAQDLFVNEGGKAETVKALDAVAPDRGIAVFAQAFVVKSVDLCDLTALLKYESVDCE